MLTPPLVSCVTLGKPRSLSVPPHRLHRDDMWTKRAKTREVSSALSRLSILKWTIIVLVSHTCLEKRLPALPVRLSEGPSPLAQGHRVHKWQTWDLNTATSEACELSSTVSMGQHQALGMWYHWRGEQEIKGDWAGQQGTMKLS